MFFTKKLSNGFGTVGQWIINETHMILEIFNKKFNVSEKHYLSYTFEDIASFILNRKKYTNQWASVNNDEKISFVFNHKKVNKNPSLTVNTNRHRFVIQINSYKDQKNNMTLFYQKLAMSIKGLVQQKDDYQLHGLLGQTANRPRIFRFDKKYPIEGNPDEYKVSGKYAHQYVSSSKCKKSFHKNVRNNENIL